MDIICYNLGKLHAHLNGDEIQLSFSRDESDDEWTRGNVKIDIDGSSCTDTVGFFYNWMTPAEARGLADILNDLADKSEEIYKLDPIYVALENGKPMYDKDTDSYVTFFSEADAERETNLYQEYDNEGIVYTYRALTVQEYWKWHKENVIE